MKDGKLGKTWSKTSVQNLVKHRSGGYYARLFLGGKERWRSLKTKVLEVARVRLREEQRQADQFGHVAKPTKAGRMTMAMAIETLLNDVNALVPLRQRGRKSQITASSAKYRLTTLESLRKTWLKTIGREFDSQEIRKITKSEVWRWAEGQRKILSSTRFNNTLGTLRRLFDIAVQAGEIHLNLTQEIVRSYKPPKTTYTPTTAEFFSLVTAIRRSPSHSANDAADYIEFLAYTGARKEEAALVTWADLDLAREKVTFRKTKNGLIRTVELIPSACELLVRIRTSRSQIEPKERIFKISEAYRSLSAASAAIGIPKITHHDLRDLFATTAVESGIDIPTVADWLGHRDGGALLLERYRKHRDAHAKQAAKRVSFGPVNSSV